jgi:trk system potassium uptake protein TrkH
MTVSTAGGIKIMRVLLLLLQSRKELSVLAYPHDVKSVSFEERPVNIELMQTVWVFFALFNASIAALMLIFSFTGLSFEHSLAAAVAAISNAGPMLDMVGIDSVKLYSNLPDAASWAMSLGMIGGRVELLALLSLLSPIYWKRAGVWFM